MIINREKVVCALGAALVVVGVIYTAGNWSVATRVVSIPRPDKRVVVVPTAVDSPRTLQEEFDRDFRLVYPGRRNNPFQAPHGRRQVFASDYPLPLPWDKPIKKNVPVPGTFTRAQFRGALLQAEPPAEQKRSRLRPDTGNEEDEEGEGEEEEEEK